MNKLEIETVANTVSSYPLFTNLGTEMYGAGRVLKQYGFYPRFFPLWVSATHSINLAKEPWGFELNPWFPFSLVYNDRFHAAIRDKGSSWVYKIMAPFAIYKRQKNITQSTTATGTIAFYTHSVSWANIDVDFDAYVQSLMDLPSHMHPITVCLHYLDVQNGVHDELMRRGLHCVCVGHSSRPDFIASFYSIVRNYKFAISNHMSTSLIYCSDLGLVSSVYGIVPETFYYHRSFLESLSGEFLEKMPPDIRGEADPEGLLLSYQQARDWFSQSSRVYEVAAFFEGFSETVTTEQKRVVSEELGLENGISRLQAAVIFYSALICAPIKLAWLFLRQPALLIDRGRTIINKIIRDVKKDYVS